MNLTLGRLRSPAWRIGRRITLLCQQAGFDPISWRRVRERNGWERLGDACAWYSPPLQAGAICYCVGVGEDVSFDFALIDRYDAEVFAFDPTPRAGEYVRMAASGVQNFHFFPYAVWQSNETVKMFAPADLGHVSHSIVNLQRTDTYFEAPGRTIESIMDELGHDHIDLLKLDIEGAEYSVLKAILSARIPIGVLNVEFDELSITSRGFRPRIRQAVDLLVSNGYRLVLIDSVSNYHFVQSRGTN